MFDTCSIRMKDSFAWNSVRRIYFIVWYLLLLYLWTGPPNPNLFPPYEDDDFCKDPNSHLPYDKKKLVVTNPFQYLQCTKGKATLVTCKGNQIFIPQAMACVDPTHPSDPKHSRDFSKPVNVHFLYVHITLHKIMCFHTLTVVFLRSDNKFSMLSYFRNDSVLSQRFHTFVMIAYT